MMSSADLMRRLKNDLADIYSDSDMDGIYVCPDDEDTRKVHALIVGPDGTPYEKGFFYFIFSYPENYPLSPPAVKLMTTGNGTVRFNPNLYNCGKVCLSILGTWSGPGWTSVMTTKSVLISIRSLMNEKPFYNEPGYEGKHYENESKSYNERVTHDTLRVAVIDMVNTALIPASDVNASSSNNTFGDIGGAAASPPQSQPIESSSLTNGSSSSVSNGANDASLSASASSVASHTLALPQFAGPLSKKSKKQMMESGYATSYGNRFGNKQSGPFLMPQVLKEMVIRLFYKKYSFYLDLVEKNGKKDTKSSTAHARLSIFLSPGYKFEYSKLKVRLEEVYKKIRIDENLALELYESLKTSYCPVRTVSPEEEEEMTALFNED